MAAPRRHRPPLLPAHSRRCRQRPAVLHPDLLASTLQQDPADRGGDRPGGRYNNAFWADSFTSTDGFQCTFSVPYMAGYSGNIAALLPNGVSYYYFSDNRDFSWHPAVAAADQIAPICPRTE